MSDYWLIEGRTDMSVAGTDQILLFDWLFDCLVTDWLKEEPIKDYLSIDCLITDWLEAEPMWPIL